MDGDNVARLYDKLEHERSSREKDYRALAKSISKIERSTAEISQCIRELNKRDMTMKQDLCDIMDEKVALHEAKCSASDIVKLKRKGLLDDAKDFGSQHPFFSFLIGSGLFTGAVNIFINALKLVFEYI